MISRILVAGYILTCALSMFVPDALVNAQTADDKRLEYNLESGSVDGGVGSGNPVDSAAQNPERQFQLVSCTGVVDPRTGKGVECDYNQVIYTIARIIRYIFYVMIPVVLGMIIFTGFKYMMAGGDANLIADAKRMFKPIFIGIALILGAYLIVYNLILGNLISEKGVGDIKKEDIINKGKGF